MNKNDSTDCLTEWLETNPEMEQDGHGQRSSERSADRLGSDGLHGGGGGGGGVDGAERTLERARSKHKMADSSSSSAPTSASSKSREREPSEPRPAAAGDAGVASADGHAHNGSVWLGICGRGIDIYEVTSLKHPFNLANPVKPSKTQ